MVEQQGNKWYELQATLGLCELWRVLGRQEEARERLAAIYNWFTEGFDTPILQTAAALLAELEQERESPKQMA